MHRELWWGSWGDDSDEGSDDDSDDEQTVAVAVAATDTREEETNGCPLVERETHTLDDSQWGVWYLNYQNSLQTSSGGGDDSDDGYGSDSD